MSARHNCLEKFIYPNIKHQEHEYFEKVKCFDSGLIGSNRG